MPISAHYTPAPHHLELGPEFFDAVKPANFPQTILRFQNLPWADRLGLGQLTLEEWREHFALFKPLPENLPTPLALRYHGHQFRSYNPDLGDGRGFLFAQLNDPVDGRLLDLGTKGSGQTPWSRSGDGRLTLKGAVREVLATEMLEALGVDTSKTFSVYETGESLIRHDEPSPTRSAVLVRLNHSHIRFGTFQRLAVLGDKMSVEKLLNYSIQHYYPELKNLKNEDKPAAFLAAVTERSASLCASWMIAGFVHGVLNTDNMNITGESFDYGPYRFLPTYDPNFTAAYFDQTGLYSYGRQPESVLWNLERLAECLTLLADVPSLTKALETFSDTFNSNLLKFFFKRLGLVPQSEDEDFKFFAVAYQFLESSQIGYDRFFFDFFGGSLRLEQQVSNAKYSGSEFDDFKLHLIKYSASENISGILADPYFSAEQPCSLLIDEIESIWKSIAEQNSWQAFDDKVTSIRAMGRLFNKPL